MLQAQPRPRSEILAVTRTSRLVELRTQAGAIRIEPITDTLVRVAVILGTEWGQGALERFVNPEAAPDWTLAEGTDIEVVTQQVRVSVSRSTGAITFLDREGKVLLAESYRVERSLEKFDAMQTDFEASVVTRVETPDGWKDVIAEPKRVFRKSLYRARFSWQWSSDEALYGLGQHDNGVLNLRGTRQYIHQANMKIAMPLLVSTGGYGLLFDTAAPLIFNDDENGSYVFLEAVEQPAFYFLQGQSLDAVVAGYRQITGKASLLPRWCFGYIQCQERYETQQEMLDVVKEYRRRQLPLDAIVLDWMSWPDGQWGQKSFDPTRFPDPQALTDGLHALGAKMMISIWPVMAAVSADHQELKAQGHLFPLSEIYNAFSAEARQAYWDQVDKGLFTYGIDAWWCDSSEPVTPEWNLIERPEPDRAYREFFDAARTWMGEEHANAFPLWHARGIDEGQRSRTREKRVVNLTRSAWAGSQRYGAILWSGDTSASWQALAQQIPAGLGLAASGLPYWTLDIGAFFVKRGQNWFWDGLYEQGNADPAYRELYVRWFQFGAFLPMFRAHGTDTRREIWAFGEPGELVYDTLVKFLKLRYSLVPYLYSLAAEARDGDGTLMRLLAYDFPQDRRVWDLKDQFLLGRAFLVCPVTEPLGAGPDSRTVCLPQGADWWDFWTHQKHSGGQTLEAPAPLEILPLYVRAGSLVPLAEPVQTTANLSNDRVILQIFPGADGAFSLYQDDGETLASELGQWSRVELTWDDANRVLSLGARQGSWPGMPLQITFDLQLVSGGATTLVYQGEACRVTL